MDENTIVATCVLVESYKRVAEHQIAILVPEFLQMTRHGLGLAMGRIPFSERKKFCSYKINREYYDEDGRWWLVDVELR